MALTAANDDAEAAAVFGADVGSLPWVTQVTAVVSRETVRRWGGADGARQSLHSMQADTGTHRFPAFGGRLQVLEVNAVSDTSGGSPGSSREPPVFVLAERAFQGLSTLLLGFTPTHGVLGLVAVIRGYLTPTMVSDTGEEDTGNPGSTREWQVFRPGGHGWPGEEQHGVGQPVMAAFARTADGRSSMLAQRVAGPGQVLLPSSPQDWVDVSARSNLGFVSLSETADVVLGFALGETAEAWGGLGVPEAGWLVGRWWLRQLLIAIRGQLRTGVPASRGLGLSLEMSDALMALVGSWEAIRADQSGPRLLGQLLQDEESRWLPEALLAEECMSKTPSQQWLWEQLESTVEASQAPPGVVVLARAKFAQDVGLSEPEGYAGGHWSNDPN